MLPNAFLTNQANNRGGPTFFIWEPEEGAQLGLQLKIRRSNFQRHGFRIDSDFAFPKILILARIKDLALHVYAHLYNIRLFFHASRRFRNLYLEIETEQDCFQIRGRFQKGDRRGGRCS